MKVHSETIVVNFPPMRVRIDLYEAVEMDALHALLEMTNKLPLTALQRALVDQLLPAFTRL
jgi:hypothetical protein